MVQKSRRKQAERKLIKPDRTRDFANRYRMAFEKNSSEKWYVLQYRQRRFASSARSYKWPKIDIAIFLPIPTQSRFAEVLRTLARSSGGPSGEVSSGGRTGLRPVIFKNSCVGLTLRRTLTLQLRVGAATTD